MLRWICITGALLVSSLSAQSIYIYNVDNYAISPSAVVGDSYSVQITGAAHNALVTLTFSQNGVPGVWNAGYTDANGNWTQPYYPPKTTAAIGVWTEQWSVGGLNVGPNYTFEVFDMPRNLSVVSVGAAWPDGCGNTWAGTFTYPYGPSASIEYQTIGSSGSDEIVPSSGLGLMLEPQEYGVAHNSGGNNWFGPGDIGTNDYTPWTPPSSNYTSPSGTFYDIPFSFCGTGPFSSSDILDRTITIKIGNSPYTVRTDSWQASSYESGHGEMSNFGDVSYSQ